jgi:proteic killer suppression protein
MIQSFSDSDTEQLFFEESNRRFNNIARIALRKLIQLNRADKIEDLSVPPGNRLEALKGTLLGFHSIRINSSGESSFNGLNQDLLKYQLLTITNKS